jgi:hypothetical protein
LGGDRREQKVIKLHRQLFNEISELEAEAQLKRALRLPPDDPRRIAFVQSHTDKFSNTLFNGTPDPLTPLTSDEFRSAVQNKAGAFQTALTPLVGLPINTKAQSTYVDPSGHNLKKLVGAPHDGTRQNHDAMLDTLSKALARAGIRHMGGRYGNPRTCKGTFRTMALRYAQLIADGNPIEKVLQLIIPDLNINGLSLQGNSPLAGVRTLCDLKTLSPGGAYTENRSDKPNAAVNARQKSASETYIRRTENLDRALGITEDDYGFCARLKEFGPHNDRGRVNIPVVGSFGEMSDDTYTIARAIAEELANEHCGYYRDRSVKTVTSFFRNQLYRTWGLRAHRGWARLLLDRRSLVQIPNAPRHHVERSYDSDFYDEQTAFDSYVNPEAGFQYGPGFQGH